MSLIYIVDDDPSIIEIATVLLESQDHFVKAYTSKEELFKGLLEKKPELLIVDYILENITGINLIDDLFDEFGIQTYPIVLLSGGSSKIILSDVSAHGFDYYLSKPIDPVNFVTDIKHILNEKVKIQDWLGFQNQSRYSKLCSSVCTHLVGDLRHNFLFGLGFGTVDFVKHAVLKNEPLGTVNIILSAHEYEHVVGLLDLPNLHHLCHTINIFAPKIPQADFKTFYSRLFSSTKEPTIFSDTFKNIFFHEMSQESYLKGGVTLDSFVIGDPKYVSYQLEFRGFKVLLINSLEHSLEMSYIKGFLVPKLYCNDVIFLNPNTLPIEMIEMIVTDKEIKRVHFTQNPVLKGGTEATFWDKLNQENIRYTLPEGHVYIEGRSEIE